jgi:hypothetical protein
VAAVGSGWLRWGAAGCGGERLAAVGSGWLRWMAAGWGWERVAAVVLVRAVPGTDLAQLP